MSVPETFPHGRALHLRNVLLWDGACGFCARSVQWLHRHSRVAIETRPVQSVLADLPADVCVTAERQVLWVGANGQVEGGSRAIIAALRAAGRPGWALALRLLQPFTRWGYRLVARHRGRLGTPACGLR